MSAPGRTLITLSLEAYIQSADTLRQLADVSPSDRRTRFDGDKKRETLRQLRSQFENGRKLFNFSCVNASTYFHNDQIHSDNNYNFIGSGLQAAAKVVEVGTSSMTAQERKRFENAVPKRGRGGYGGYYNDYGGGYGRGAPRANETNMDRATAQKVLGIYPPSGYGQARGVCYNCQKPGHFAKQCPEPPKVKRAREDPE